MTSRRSTTTAAALLAATALVAPACSDVADAASGTIEVTALVHGMYAEVEVVG